MKKMTVVLIVEAIEQQLPFWEERMGFQRGAAVPLGDALGFVILTRDGVELMLQSRASVAADIPALAEDTFCAALFVEVLDLDDVLRRIEGLPRVVEPRTTAYGMREVGVRDPAGNMVLFAQPVVAT